MVCLVIRSQWCKQMVKRTFIKICEAVDCQFNYDKECAYKDITINENFECKHFKSV